MLVIVGLFVVAVIASALIGWRFARESVPVAGPIVLISIDPLPAAGLSIYGGPAGALPHLERLAAASVIFDRAFSHSPASLPAHTSLLTGQLPFEHGVRDDVGFVLDGDTPTLASRLADRGFDTGAAVSSLLLAPGTGLDRGFAVYDANLPVAAPDAFVAPAERDDATTAQVAVAWLDRQDSERFFYTLHLNGARRDDGSRADSGGGPASATVASPRGASSTGASAAGTNAGAAGLADAGPAGARGASDADAAVGAFLAALERKGWYDDALVMVTSTYGGPPADGDPGRGYTLASPVRWVPLFVKMPGATESRRFGAPVQHIDITPTLLDLVRAPGVGELRGRSLRAVLEDDATAIPPQTIYAEAMTGALRHGWAELSEPSDQSFQSSVEALTPAILPEAARHRLAMIGQVVPTLPPQLGPGTEPKPDPRAMRAAIAAYGRASRHDAARAFAPAIAEYRGIVTAHPGDADAWRRLGVNASRLGRIDEATSAFTRVTALRPELGIGLLESARAALKAGHLEQARLLATAATEATSATAAETRADAHALLASLAATTKDPDEAIAQATRAQQAMPGRPFVAFTEGRLLHDRNEHDAAVARFDAAVKAAAPDVAPIELLQWYRGDSLAKLNRPADARAAFAAAIDEAPLDVRGYVSLATLERAGDQPADAAVTIERLVRSVPTPEGYAAAVRLWTAFGDRARAAALRLQARDRFKGEPVTRALAR